MAYERGCAVFRFPRGLAGVYLLLAATRLHNPLGWPALLSFLPLLLVAGVVRELAAREDPAAAAVPRLSWREFALLVLSAPLWALLLLWKVLPD